jgi:hypothetical protein
MSSKTETESKQVEDFLNVDPPIPGQNYALISIVNPEQVVKSREKFLMKRFLEHVLAKERRESLESKLDTDGNLTYTQVDDLYEGFLLEHEDEINKEFNEENNFQTSMRAFKVRAVCDTLKEAQIRAQRLHKMDPNFDIFTAQVGYWLPICVSASKLGENVEYSEQELNTLMKEYHKNREYRNEMFEKNLEEQQRKAKEEGQKAKKIGPDDELEGIPTELPDEVKEHTGAKMQVYDDIRKRKIENDLHGSGTATEDASTGVQSTGIFDAPDPWEQNRQRRGADAEEGTGEVADKPAPKRRGRRAKKAQPEPAPEPVAEPAPKATPKKRAGRGRPRKNRR